MSVSPVSPLLNGLNPQQIQAVSAPEGAALIIAGPGSGKTAVLTRRVAYLIREMGVPPYRIMAVTFTNKAAGEMRERINKLLGDRMPGLSVGTFHSICARILRREAEHAGLKPDYVIYDTDDQISIMKRAIAEQGLDDEKTNPRKFLNRVSAAKNELISPHEYPEGGQEDRLTAKLYVRYQALLRQSNALDFDDLLMQSVLLFQRKLEVLERYRDNFSHILVDEFQDTNVAQYELVRLLAGKQNSLFCVGDPDQSIYRFRGADYRNVNRFQRDYPEAQVILLEQNYRSHQLILDAAMAIIDQNTNRIRKALKASRPDGQKIMLRQLSDENDEAQYVVWTIREYQRAGKYHLRDCAVMYRTNAQSRALEDTFRRANIPYRLIGGVRFYSRKEVRDVLAYLRLIHNPDDSVSLERIINVPARGIGKQTVTKLKEWSANQNRSLYESIQAIGSDPTSPFSGKAAKSLVEFSSFFPHWREMRDKSNIGDLIKDVLERTTYIDFLKDGTPEGEERIENVLELYRSTAAQGEKHLAEFLEEIALVSDVDNLDESADGAVMLTLHSAKGLEFPVVFLVGLEEGLLPHSQSAGDDEQLAEERRLMYVGITRAKDVLHITWALRRAMFGGLGERTLASRFLGELPPEVTTGTQPPRPGSSRADGYQRVVTTWKPPLPSYTPAVPRSSRPSTTNLTPVYKPKQRVRHERFGDGTIIASAIRGGEEEIDVKFDKHGIKRLSTSIAPLILIEDE